jgi:hypothetical protein
VVLPPDARLLVTAEGRVRRIDVVTVRPHPACLDVAARPVGGVDVPRPDSRADPVERVVGDLHHVVVVVEAGDRHDGSEDLLLEDPHLVVALEDGRLDVVAAEVFDHEPNAPWAASTARSTSSEVPRAISVKSSPVTGVGFAKYCPFAGGVYSPPMKCPSRDS